MERRVVVKLLGSAKETYLELERKTAEEIAKGKQSSFNQTLLRSIKKKFEVLKTKCDYGDEIGRAIYSKTKYMHDYEITNLYRLELAGYKRMIYTLKQHQRTDLNVQTIVIWLDVLDIVDHKEYDRIFNYKGRR